MSTPNYALALALSAAGWSNAETARQINSYAVHRGYRGVAVDTARVGRWIRCGERPRPPVHQLLADLLSAHLAQPYTPQSLGLVRARDLRIPLEEAEHAALLHRAAAANLPPEEYARALLRSALSSHESPS
ncbi:hypothetical protein ABZ746_23275 [Streptomyces sp. NPDC020096]